MASRTYDSRLFARVEFILRRQLDIATQEHYLAKVEFWQISATPGLPDERQLDDSDRKCVVTRNALATAHQRLNDFVLKGTVPDDLKRPDFVREKTAGRAVFHAHDQ